MRSGRHRAHSPKSNLSGRTVNQRRFAGAHWLKCSGPLTSAPAPPPASSLWFALASRPVKSTSHRRREFWRNVKRAAWSDELCAPAPMRKRPTALDQEEEWPAVQLAAIKFQHNFEQRAKPVRLEDSSAPLDERSESIKRSTGR